jgi:hypothetical protein
MDLRNLQRFEVMQMVKLSRNRHKMRCVMTAKKLLEVEELFDTDLMNRSFDGFLFSTSAPSTNRNDSPLRQQPIKLNQSLTIFAELTTGM